MTAPRALPAGALLAASLSCGCSVASLSRAGRIDDAWKTLCSDVEGDGTPGDAGARLALRDALRTREAASIDGRAMSGKDVAGRVGAGVFRDEVVVLQLRLSTAHARAAPLSLHARLSLGGGAGGEKARVLHEVTGNGVWALAGVQPGSTSTSVKAPGGAGILGDLLIGAMTLGAVDAGLRYQLLERPRLAGTLTYLARAPSPRCAAAGEEPCEALLVLAPRGGDDRSGAGIPLSDRPAEGDALVVRIHHAAGAVAGEKKPHEACDLQDEVVLRLPPGASTVERINALFARGPVEVLPGKP